MKMYQKNKCIDFNACREKCLQCDISQKTACEKIFEYDTPQPFLDIRSKDHYSLGRIACPTCGASVGQAEQGAVSRCPCCTQMIQF